MLATHLTEVCWLHVTSTIKAEHRPVLKGIDGCHHAFLWVPTLCLPLLVEGLLLLRCASDLHLGMQFDGQGAANKLHPLTERGEPAGKDRVTHAKAIECIGDTPSIARSAEASDAFEISNR